MIEIPEVVRNKAVTAGAGEWLAALPALVGDLAAEWGLRLGAAFTDATEAFVVGVTCADNTPAVLKVVVPRDGDAALHEITVLRLGGAGCVRLLRDDVDRGAMLLERLGPSLFELGLPIGRRHEILCDTARRLWSHAPDCGLPTGAEKGRWLIDSITSKWEALDRPCSERVVDHAVACATRRIAAHDDERAVLVHGDVHQWNVLAADEACETFKLVDPDGLIADAEYDLGIVMREDPVELVAGDPYERAHWLADRCGLDARAIWEWGVVERVSTGLIGTQIGLQPSSRDMLDAAERISIRFRS